MATEKLFSGFPGISSSEWREKIEADLKGADFYKKLVWKSDEGFDVQPYYRQEDLEKLSTLGSPSTNDWLIRQDYMKEHSAEEWNAIIEKAIKLGIQSVGLNLNSTNTSDPGFFEKILQGIDFEVIELNFTGVNNPLDTFSALTNYFKSKNLNAASLRGCLGVDPFGDLCSSGEYNEAGLTQIAEIIQSNSLFPNLKILSLNAGNFQNGGSTLSQELGFGLAMATDSIDKLEQLGCSPKSVIQAISFEFVTGPNYFMEIAKIRSARRLWSAICNAWGVNDHDSVMHIYSRTASWNLTVYDANVNMLRTTTEAMSASLGGSDSISVLPFDISFREENDFSARIAKNTQIILKDEAHLNKVADPSAGSYYIEQLTEELGKQAWKHFLELEERNGFLEAFKSGFVQEQVKQSANIKREKAASRRSSILGVNQYPNFSEMIFEQGISLPQKEKDKKTSYQPIHQFTVAEEFEALRFQTEKSGKRPKVFLLKYGDPAWRTARAMFAGNFFACAGYEIVDPSGFKSAEEGMKAAKKARADVVVLCSSDVAYAELDPKVFSEMHGNSVIVVAGYPKDEIEELKKKGLEHFIHVKSNLLEELAMYNSLLIENKK